MKTHEIISEAGILQSLGTNILKGLGSLVGRGAVWRTAEEYAPEIARKASQLGRKLSDAEVAKIVKNSSESVQEALEKALERKMARDPRATRLTRDEIDAVIAAHPNPDPKLIKEIQKKADKLVKDLEWEKAKAPFKGFLEGAKTVKEVTGTLVNLGFEAYFISQVTKPLQEYWDIMEDADAWVQKGQIPPQFANNFSSVQEWYDWYRKRELSVMIGKQALVLGGGLVARAAPAAIAAFLRLIKLPGMAALASNAGKLAGGIFAGALAEGELADGVAKLMTVNIMGFSAVNLVGAPVASALDSVGRTAWEKASKSAPATTVADKPTTDKPVDNTTSTQNTKPVEKKPEADGKQPAPADTTAPKVDPNATPIDKWVNLGGGYIKDPKTGEIKRSVARQFQ
jgi:hypothetical protein